MRFLKILVCVVPTSRTSRSLGIATPGKKKMSRRSMLRAALILAAIRAQTSPPASGPAEPSEPSEPAPPEEPSPPACADDATWHKKGDEAKNCQWVEGAAVEQSVL